MNGTSSAEGDDADRPRRPRRAAVFVALAGALVVLLVVLAVVVVWPGSDAPAPTGHLANASFALDPRVAPCFVLPHAINQPDRPVAPVVEHWPSAQSRMLILGNDGELWVIDGGAAVEWADGSDDARHSAIVWAAWMKDGSILTARVGNTDVELARLTAPNRAIPAAHLAYIVKADAPAGSCPIDGYLATFAVINEGVVFLRHVAGPIDHSCPYQSKPGACTSPEAYSIEVRGANLAAKGRATGDSGGGPGIGRSRLVSASRATESIVIDEGSSNLTMRVGLENRFCCLGGQKGMAFGLAPDGRRIAYASLPTGHNLRIGPVEPGSATDFSGEALWTSPERIDALAWTGSTLAVAHGSAVSLVAVPGATVGGEVTLGGTTVRTVDWEHQR